VSRHDPSGKRQHGPQPKRFLSFPDLRERKGIRFSRTWVNELIRQGKFPKKIHISANRVGWLEGEIDAFLGACAESEDLQETLEV
jgi:predicted DNA-binding transcriptional regulator AlpA